MSRKSLAGRLPALVPEQVDGPPCHKCSALCCRYFALQIDTPASVEDFDHVKWYLIHQDTWVWVDDGDWYVQVDQKCRHLGPHNECTIYERRPQICRDYGVREKLEHPDDPLCDYFTQDVAHDQEFRTLDQLEIYAKRHLAQLDAQRKRRSEAAKRAWRARRAVEA